jgi:hypothetical protein
MKESKMLRDLTNAELEFVSGGDGEQPPPDDEIIVNGHRIQASLSDDLWSHGGINENYTDFEVYDAQWQVVFYEFGKAVLAFLAGLAAAYLADELTDEERKAAEKDMAVKFGNTNVTGTQTATDGTVFYKGADGWTYVDADGNGQLGRELINRIPTALDL